MMSIGAAHKLRYQLPPRVPGHGIADRETSSPGALSLSRHVDCRMMQSRLTQNPDRGSDLKMRVNVTQKPNVIDYDTTSRDCFIALSTYFISSPRRANELLDFLNLLKEQKK